MKYFIILLLTVFILSCASAPQISDDGFISSQPNFQVQFNKPIIKKSVESRRIRDGDIKAYLFLVNNTEGILIQILAYIPDPRVDYYYGPVQVLTNWGRLVLDPVVIDGSQWIKFVDVINNNLLFTGYFRFMDTSYISVGRICNASACAEKIGSFQKGASLDSGQGELWAEAFAHTDQLFSIGKVTPAEPEFAHSDLSLAQQKSFKKYLDPALTPHLKAFAIEISGDRAGWSLAYHKPAHAIETAMDSCERKGAKCLLYAVGERVVTNYSKEQLANFLHEYYEKVFPPGDLRNIIQRALSGGEIKTLISGREVEGEGSRAGTKYTMKFMASGQLLIRIAEAKASVRTGNYKGEWWIEGDRW